MPVQDSQGPGLVILSDRVIEDPWLIPRECLFCEATGFVPVDVCAYAVEDDEVYALVICPRCQDHMDTLADGSSDEQ